MASSAAKVAIPSRCERPAPAPAPLWTRNFIAGTFLNFFIAGNYFMLMVVMTAYALTVYQAPAAVAAFCASAFIVGTLFSRFAAAPMMERFGRLPLLIVGCIAEVALSALYLLNEPVGALTRASGPRVLLRRVLHHHRYGHYQRGAARAQGRGHRVLYAVHHPCSAIGPFAGIFLANNFGYPVVFVVASVLVALSIPAALLLRPASSTKVKGSEAAAEAEVEAAADAVAGAVAEAPDEEAREDAAANRDEALAASTRVPSTHLEEKVAAKVEHSPLAVSWKPAYCHLGGVRPSVLRLFQPAHVPHALRH